MPDFKITPKEESELTREMRENLMTCVKIDKPNRDAYRDNTKMLAGDQWEPGEAQKRRNKRLMLTADQLNGPVDQVVNSIRQNKPGPSVTPSGGGTDTVDARIMEGLLRRIDYENRAWQCFGIAMETATGGNFGCWALDLDNENERSFKRVIRYRPIPNANETVFFDTAAIERDRSDATWAMEVLNIPLSTYKARFGTKYDGSTSKIAAQGPIQGIANYFQSFTDDSMKGWVTTDGVKLAKYWRVSSKVEPLRLYSNGLAYFDSERDIIPADIFIDTKEPMQERERKVIRWYLMNGVEVLRAGEWPGQWIPLIPVYGRERWIDGKRVLQSLIQLAKMAQQAFNFAFTGACETLASATKSPWLGLLGQFRSKLAQWKSANTDIHAYMEYDEVTLSDGTFHTAPPTRNIQEPPIQSFLAFCTLCSLAIQRATSIFDPSLGKQKSDQSGRAIQELQAESNEGNYHWADNLTVALNHNYRVIGDLVQNEYDAPQVEQIMRVDGGIEEVRINTVYKSGIDISTGKETTRFHNIARGNFAYTVGIGKAYDSERAANSAKITDLMKVLPPQLIAQAVDLFIKLQNYGPLGDELAARLTPAPYRDNNDPSAQAVHLAEMMQQNQQLMATVQQLHTAIATKQPELEVRKWIAAVNAVAGIEEAKIKKGIRDEDRLQETVEKTIGLAHEAATAEADRLHSLDLAKLNSQTQLQSTIAAQGSPQDQ